MRELSAKPEGRWEEEQLSLLRRLLELSPAMMAYWDRDQRCRFANRAYEKWFGVTPESLIGKTMRELLGPIYPLNLPYIERALAGEPQEFEREIPDPAGGPPRHSHAIYIPDTVDGEVRGMFVLVVDISQRRRLEDELRAAKERADELATHDLLTGLPNRLLLADRIGRTVELATRNKHRFAVLFLDLDGFKRVNDSLGHAMGDALLCAVAARIVSALRGSDTVARVGGDELSVLLPELDSPDDAAGVARKLHEAMRGEPFAVAGKSLKITFSTGIAIFPEDGKDMRELLAHADEALYRAKRAGGDRYAFYRE